MTVYLLVILPFPHYKPTSARMVPMASMPEKNRRFRQEYYVQKNTPETFPFGVSLVGVGCQALEGRSRVVQQTCRILVLQSLELLALIGLRHYVRRVSFCLSEHYGHLESQALRIICASEPRLSQIV
jgi:hypothetical protein